MKIAIHQPNYLPWIGYFDKMDQVDKFILLDTALYSKSGFINRNKIKTPQGELWLTVPLKNKHQPINEIQIANELNWQQRHWNSIENYYKKSPYWTIYCVGLEQIYKSKWENISNLNISLINYIIKLLNIKTEIILGSDYDWKFGSGNMRNMKIVDYFGGDIYVSGIGAKAYNVESVFTDNNINLVYQDFKHPIYEQKWGEFIPNLSILDMLFNCGPETIDIIRKKRDEL